MTAPVAAARAAKGAGAAKGAKSAKAAKTASDVGTAAEAAGTVADAKNKRAYEAGRRDARAGRPPNPGTGAKAPDPFAYDRGYQAGLDGDDEAKSTSTKSSSSSKRSRTSSGGRRRSSKRSKRSSTARKAQRSLGAPIAQATGSALTTVGAGILLAIAYNLLTNAAYAEGFFGGVTRALLWIEDPTKSIPYRSDPS